MPRLTTAIPPPWEFFEGLPKNAFLIQFLGLNDPFCHVLGTVEKKIGFNYFKVRGNLKFENVQKLAKFAKLSIFTTFFFS